MQKDNLQINIPISKTTAVVCEECNNDTFVQVLYVRNVSRFLVGSPEDMQRVIPTFACSKCQHVNKELSISKLVEDDSQSAD